MQHKQDEPVRAYLLGTLHEPQATEVDEKYFVDREFFDQVRNIETKLIRDYLQGRLRQSQKLLFEGRYLKVASLSTRVEEVRLQLGTEEPREKRDLPGARWQVFAGSVATLILTSFVGYGLLHQAGSPPKPEGPRVVDELPVSTIRLAPGVVKGGASPSVNVPAPIGSQPIRFLLELPGKAVVANYRVSVASVRSDGSSNIVWESGAVQSVAGDTSSTLTVDVPGKPFSRGDYVVEVRSMDNFPLETYSFHFRSNF